MKEQTRSYDLRQLHPRRWPEVETLNGTSAVGLTLTGNEFNNTVIGAGGNDTLIGGAGNDTLNGGAGADAMSAARATTPTSSTMPATW